jgi:hypothetical protein
VVTRSEDKVAIRAAARGSWPVRRHQLAEEPSDDLRATTTAEERLAMMWPLAVEAFSLTGQPFPAYVRGETPVARRRLGE